MHKVIHKIDDVCLWHSFLEGDRDAYEEIYRIYLPMLHEYGIRLCQDIELTKDSIQDLFVKIWINRKNLSPTDSIRPYLCSALRSIILDRLDQLSRMRKRESLSVEKMIFDLHYTIEDKICFNDEETEQKKRVLRALNSLTPRQNESIFLRFYLGLEYAEIADIMHVSVKASYKIIGRSIAVMRKYFNVVLYSLLLLLLTHIVL